MDTGWREIIAKDMVFSFATEFYLTTNLKEEELNLLQEK